MRTVTNNALADIKRKFGSVLGWYGNGDPVGVDETRMDRRLYGTNTVTYMILLAIAEGATHIGVWGVDMAVDTEYHYQRPCEINFFIVHLEFVRHYTCSYCQNYKKNKCR